MGYDPNGEVEGILSLPIPRAHPFLYQSDSLICGQYVLSAASNSPSSIHAEYTVYCVNSLPNAPNTLDSTNVQRLGNIAVGSLSSRFTGYPPEFHLSTSGFLPRPGRAQQQSDERTT